MMNYSSTIKYAFAIYVLLQTIPLSMIVIGIIRVVKSNKKIIPIICIVLGVLIIGIEVVFVVYNVTKIQINDPIPVQNK
jgi:hypothetical protein